MEKIKLYSVCDNCHADANNLNDEHLCMSCGNYSEIIEIDDKGNEYDDEGNLITD